MKTKWNLANWHHFRRLSIAVHARVSELFDHSIGCRKIYNKVSFLMKELSIIEQNVKKKKKKDNVASFVRTKSTQLVRLARRNSCEICWRKSYKKPMAVFFGRDTMTKIYGLLPGWSGTPMEIRLRNQYFFAYTFFLHSVSFFFSLLCQVLPSTKTWKYFTVASFIHLLKMDAFCDAKFIDQKLFYRYSSLIGILTSLSKREKKRDRPAASNVCDLIFLHALFSSLLYILYTHARSTHTHVYIAWVGTFFNSVSVSLSQWSYI